MQDTKPCPKCCLEKPVARFAKANRRDGLRSWCKDCEKVYFNEKKNALKEAVYDKLGHVCCKCGFADKRALQIDHVNGGGNQEHKQVKNAFTFLNKVLADTNGTYQILCANCNWIKRMERREHPKNHGPSEEARQRMSEQMRNRVVSDETRKKQSDSHLGQVPWNKGLFGIPKTNRTHEEAKARNRELDAARHRRYRREKKAAQEAANTIQAA